jgi:uncharacterized protein (TIGR00266 family)
VQVSIRHEPAYALAYISLDVGERIFVERNAMAAMSGGLRVQASVGGTRVSSALARKIVGNEGVLFTVYEAELFGAWVALAPLRPGDIKVLDLVGSDFLVQSGSLLCYSEGVDVSLRYGGVRSVVMQEGIAYIRVAGEGSAIITAYGAIERIEIGPDESLIVDTGHLVAFTESMQFTFGPLSSIATAALSGEGIVAKFTGPGSVFLQTRAERDFHNWVFPERDHDDRANL